MRRAALLLLPLAACQPPRPLPAETVASSVALHAVAPDAVWTVTVEDGHELLSRIDAVSGVTEVRDAPPDGAYLAIAAHPGVGAVIYRTEPDPVAGYQLLTFADDGDAIIALDEAPEALAVDARCVYTVVAGQVRAYPRAGGAPEVIGDRGDWDEITLLAAAADDDGRILIIRNGRKDAQGYGGRLEIAQLSDQGWAPYGLYEAEGRIGGAYLAGPTVFYTRQGGPDSPSSGAALAVRDDGGVVTEIGGQLLPGSLAVAAGRLYWESITSAGESIVSVERFDDFLLDGTGVVERSNDDSYDGLGITEVPGGEVLYWGALSVLMRSRFTLDVAR